MKFALLHKNLLLLICILLTTSACNAQTMDVTQHTPAQSPPTPHHTTTPQPPNPSLTPTVPSPTSTLNGPFVAFRVQDSQQFYISLLDIKTMTVREIKNELVDYPLELQWHDPCHLFVRGRLIDLQGNEIWEVPSLIERGWTSWSFGGSRLSPDKKWLVIPIYSGQPNYNSAEFVDLELVDLTQISTPKRLTTNGNAHAIGAWSWDGEWFAFSDNDDAGIAQLFRANHEGVIEQLTFYKHPIEIIEAMAWSTDNRQIAFAPHSISGEHRSWLGIVDLHEDSLIHIDAEKLWRIEKIWWGLDGSRLAFAGQSSLNLERDDPFYGSRVHWVDLATGTIENSLYGQDAPFGWFSRPQVMDSLDLLFFESQNGYYLWDGKEQVAHFLGDIQLDGMVWGTEGSPFLFPQEEVCELN